MKPTGGDLFTATRSRPAPRIKQEPLGVDARVRAARAAARALARRSRPGAPRRSPRGPVTPA